MLAARLPTRARPIRPAHAGQHTPVRAVKDVFMPALSSTMTEGKVVQWLKNEGDAVSKGDALVVVESDKADMDVESFEDGFLGSIVIEEGGTANVGSPIAFIAETEAEISDAKAKAGSSNGAAPAAPKEEAAPKVRGCSVHMAVCVRERARRYAPATAVQAAAGCCCHADLTTEPADLSVQSRHFTRCIELEWSACQCIPAAAIRGSIKNVCAHS